MRIEDQEFAGEIVSGDVQKRALTAFIERIRQDGPQPLWALEEELASRGVPSADRDDAVERSRTPAYHAANSVLDAAHAAGYTATGSEADDGYVLGTASYDPALHDSHEFNVQFGHVTDPNTRAVLAGEATDADAVRRALETAQAAFAEDEKNPDVAADALEARDQAVFDVEYAWLELEDVQSTRDALARFWTDGEVAAPSAPAL